MRLAVAAQVFGAARRARQHRLASGVLLVQQAQRVRLQPPSTLLAQAAQVLLEVLLQQPDVARPAGRVPDAVEVQAQAAQAERGVQAPLQCDQLRVERGVRLADRLDVELVELAVAALLRPVVAKAVQQ